MSLRIFLGITSICLVCLIGCKGGEPDEPEGAGGGTGGSGEEEDKDEETTAMLTIAPIAGAKLGKKLTVSVFIQSDEEKDHTAEVTLNIKCDGKDTLKNAKQEAVKENRTATFKDILTLTEDAAKGIKIDKKCVVTASATLSESKVEARSATFSISHAPTISWLGNELLIEHASDYVQLEDKGNTNACDAQLLLWPEDIERPKIALPYSGFNIKDGKLASIYPLGDLTYCNIIIDDDKVEISGTAPTSDPNFTTIGGKSRGRICLTPATDMDDTVTIKIAVKTRSPVVWLTKLVNQAMNTSTCHDVDLGSNHDFSGKGSACVYLISGEVFQHRCF